MQLGGQRTPLSLSESKLKARAHRPIKLGCFADLRPEENNENIPSVPLVRQQIPIPICCINNLYGEDVESPFTHPDEDVVYPEYRDEVTETIELDEGDSNESNSQSNPGSVADSLVDPISLEEIQQLVPVEGAEPSQPLVSDPEYTLASDLTAVLHVSEATQTQEITDTTVVEIEPLFEEFSNVPLTKEAKEYLEKQPLQQFPFTESKVAEAGLKIDRLLSSYSSVDSNGNLRVRRGFVAIKHLRLTEDSPELAALQQDLPPDAKINVVVTIQRGKGGVGKIVRIALDGTVCRESSVSKIANLLHDRLEIDGQKHPIAPFEKNHLTLTPVGLPYNLRSNVTNGSDQTFVMLLPPGLHRLHTEWWYKTETQDAVPRYNFKNFYQTVKDFYSATRKHDCNLWLKHEDKLTAYGLTPQVIIEATKYGHQWDNKMMNRKIMSEWSQKEETNKTKQVPAFVLNKRIIHAATQTSESYHCELQIPVFDEMATREMYKSFTPDQQEAALMSYNRKIREARLVKEKELSSLAKYYEELYNLAHHLEILSRFPQADRDGVTMIQTAEHRNTKNLVNDTFVALIDTILIDASFKKEVIQTWKDRTVTETSLPGRMPSTNELLDTVADKAESLSLHITHKTKIKRFTIQSNARSS